MAHPVVHWEIGGPDLSGLQEFYAKAFGWTIGPVNSTYALVQAAEGGMGGGLMRTHGDIPPYVTVYIQVDDLNAALDEITQLGGTRLVPPTAINDAASFAMFRDPYGNVVGLLQATDPIAGRLKMTGGG
jgi:uncharacterized protein